MENKRFYVYVLARPDGRPFYVGKGQGNRIYKHEIQAHGRCRCNKCNIIRKIWRNGGEVQRYKVLETSDEREAFEFERELIALYGRENLCNLTDGGEGKSGYRESPESKAKRVAALKNAYRNPEVKARHSAMIRRRWSEKSYRDRVALAIAEAQRTPEARASKGIISKAMWQRSEYRIQQNAAMRTAASKPEFREKMRRITFKVANSPEHREQRSIRSRQMWSDFDQRNKLVIAMKAAQRKPERRAYYSETQKAYAATEEGAEAKRRAASVSKRKRAVLTQEQANEIKGLYSTGTYTHASLARLYGVGVSTIGRVLCGEWDNPRIDG